MLRPLLIVSWLFIGSLASPAGAATSAATRPTTTQSSGAVADAPESVNVETLPQVVDRMTIAKIFRGQRKLSPEEMGHVEFWVSLIKEPLLAVIGFIPRLFVALIFLLIAWLIYRALRKVMWASMGKAHIDPSIREMLAHLLKWAIMGFGLVIACNQIGIQITALLAGVSIIGLAIGLAAQETLANFIAGVVIFWDKPFRIGDTIEIEGSTGAVKRVTFRSTRMLDMDGQMIVLPNTYVLSHKLCNQSAHELSRVSVPIRIAYKESIDEARKTMLALVRGDPRVCLSPTPMVVVSEYGDGSVKLILQFWVARKSISSPIQSEYLERVKRAFEEEGIELPFPQMHLLMQAPPAPSTPPAKPVS